MGKPAARIGDTHSCPMVNPNGTPHVGGPVIGPGCQTVLIEGKPAATVGDSCFCAGGVLDKITAGATGVFIEGKLAARMKDRCAHGGMITSGSTTVLIGGKMKAVSARKNDKDENEYKEPTAEEKVVLINQAIQDCIALLERKLALMEQNDAETLEAFEKWFGKHEDEAKVVILERIRRALEVSRRLTVKNFHQIVDEKDRRENCAQVHNKDRSYKFLLGDPFWKLDSIGKRTKASVLIHELSHFKNIGNTVDDVYYEEACLRLAKIDPKAALKNADSFEIFIGYE